MKSNGMKALLGGVAAVLLAWNLGSCNLDPLPGSDPTASPAATSSPTPTAGTTSSPTPSPTPGASTGPTATPSPTPLVTASPTPAVTASPSPTPTASPVVSLGGIIKPVADQALLLHKPLTATTTRCTMSLGKALAYNTYVPWSMESSGTLWFPVLVESGKTYTINWDDGFDSSGNYSLDLLIGAYSQPMANSAYRLAGWSSDLDTGYTTGKSITASQTQIIYLKVIPFSAGDTGTFALQVNCATAANVGQTFAWYLDGSVISAATSYLYTLDTTSLATGKHVLLALASRDGTYWSESWSFSK